MVSRTIQDYYNVMDRINGMPVQDPESMMDPTTIFTSNTDGNGSSWIGSMNDLDYMMVRMRCQLCALMMLMDPT
jgi:hypothetical protein